MQNKKKSQLLASFLSTIPGLGLFYIGLKVRALKVFLGFWGIFLVELIIVIPVLEAILNIYSVSPDSLLGEISIKLINPLFWFYGWQFYDTYTKADSFNLNPRRVKLERKK